MRTLLAALLLSFASLHVAAQPAAVVGAMQTPAWLERGSTRAPLVPGMELRAGDRIVSGDGARVLLKLSEGSVVKLGENGTLRVVELQPGRELFKGALEVLQGAFRFTTDIVQKTRKREVSVRISTVTVGLRGTDFWGRSRADLQIVCLIEGAIEVGAAGEQAVTMDKPLQFYRRDQGKTQPVGSVEPAQIDKWAQETEIESGKGALRSGGKFSVQLAVTDNQQAARGIRDQLRTAGYPAELAQRKDADKLVHTVRIRHLPSREEAQALANRLKGKYGVEEATVR